MLPDELMHEGEHMLTVCNACRYCEGYCAVWPAMEYRRAFPPGELRYLANLCHDCGDCYYACQYAPPHEFEVNPPLTFARIRIQSYEQFAWPKQLSKIFRKNGLLLALILTLVFIAFFAITAKLGGKDLVEPIADGNFYQLISHEALAVIFSLVAVYVLFALVVGFVCFWRDSGEKLSDLNDFAVLSIAVKEVLRLAYLDGDGWGCAYPGEKTSQLRKWFHHFTFYGFLLCFAATTVGAFYHFVFHWSAPYSFTSLPVVLGTLGGIGLLVGPAGLLLLKTRRNRDISDEKKYEMDITFIALIMLTSLTGLLLLVLRETSAMGPLLIVHLGFVMTLFVMIPYGKFIHSVYRFAALLKYALERKRKQILGV